MEWLPGDYNLNATLYIPQCADTNLDAGGAYFHYQQPTGDAIVVMGCLRCRLKFGYRIKLLCSLLTYLCLRTCIDICFCSMYVFPQLIFERTIWSSSSGAALAFKDRPYSTFLPTLMSIFEFQGLQKVPPDGTTGVGVYVEKHFATNKVVGTDVRGFQFGVYENSTGEGKIDTNWWWLSYVRGKPELKTQAVS